MNVCSECVESLPVEGDFVTCHRCNRKMHFGCTTLSEKSYRKMSTAKKEEWRCTSCRREAANPSIMVDGTSKSAPIATTPTQPPQKRTRSASSPEVNTNQGTTSNNNSSALLDEMKNLRTEISEIKSSCEFVANKYEQINQHMALNNDLLKKLSNEIKELKENNLKKDEQITAMESKINTLEQQIIKNNIEIKNITPTANENLMEVVKAVGKTINCQITTSDITDIFRTKTKNPKRSTIIASFSSYACKTQFVKNAKSFRKVELSKIRESMTTDQNREQNNGQIYGDTLVFVNSQLTATNKHLLWLAKNKARECNWRFVWETSGKILARKSENCEAMHIATVNDINRIST